jgi:hypothetical protein
MVAILMPELPLWKPFPTWLHNLRGNRYVTGSNPVAVFFALPLIYPSLVSRLESTGDLSTAGDVVATRTAELFNVLTTFSLGELALF